MTDMTHITHMTYISLILTLRQTGLSVTCKLNHFVITNKTTQSVRGAKVPRVFYQILLALYIRSTVMKPTAVIWQVDGTFHILSH